MKIIKCNIDMEYVFHMDKFLENCHEDFLAEQEKRRESLRKEQERREREKVLERLKSKTPRSNF